MDDILCDPESCPGQEELVHQYLDGELHSSEQETFLNHLQHCSHCQTHLTELQQLFTELAALEELSAPAGVVSYVMSHLPEAEVRPRYRTIGQLILFCQVIVGLILMAMTSSMATDTLNQRFIWRPWQIGTNLTISVYGWLQEATINMGNWLQGQWFLLGETSNLNLSPDLALMIVTGLALAWLIGNILLLQHYPVWLKSGGAR